MIDTENFFINTSFDDLLNLDLQYIHILYNKAIEHMNNNTIYYNKAVDTLQLFYDKLDNIESIDVLHSQPVKCKVIFYLAAMHYNSAWDENLFTLNNPQYVEQVLSVLNKRNIYKN